LTNLEQAVLMLVAFVLPAVTAWLANGAPTDHTSVSLMTAAILSGVLAFIKEYLGIKVSN